MTFEIYGSDNPTICIISSLSKNDKSYIFLSKMLDSKGINENNCKFISISKDKPIFSGEFSLIKDKIYSEINNSNPELVVVIGSNISSLVLDNNFTHISECHGIVYKGEFGINEFKIMPIFHPNYIIRHSSNIELKNQFRDDIQRIIGICSGEIPDQIISSNPTIKQHHFKDETHICLNYHEFDEFCKNEIDNNSMIAYDIETNAKEKTSLNYRVVGFSLASSSKRGCYVVLRSIDYNMSEKDIKLIEARLRKILLLKKILVYNYMHEELATLNWLGIEIPDVEDLFTMVKLLMGNADKYEGNGGLKIQCQMNLNTKDWSKDLDLYMQHFRTFNKNQEPMIDLLKVYYTDNEIEKLLPLIKELCISDDVYENGGKVISYGVVPYKLIGKYGGIDASILFDLLDFYKKRISDLNHELGIDLMIGYKYWMNHHFAGYTLERNGAYFNEEKASEVEDWCNKGRIETLKNMIHSDLAEFYIKDKVSNEFLLYLKDNYLTEILNGYAIPKRMYKSSVHVMIDDRITDNPLRTMFGRMSMIPNKKGIYKLELGHIETLAKKFINNLQEIYDLWYKEYIDKFNAEDHTVEEMKALINPTATGESWKNFLTSILITDDIKYAKLYTLLIGVIETPDFDINRYYGEDDKKLLELMIKLKSSEISDTKKFDIFCKFFSSKRHIKSKFLNGKINESLNYSIESMNEYYILELYDLYVLCGLDIENKDTWTDGFEFLYNLRKFKKYSKIITTYINGKVGRNNVWYVDKDSFENGDKFTTRKIPYWERNKYDLSNKIPIYQSSFLVDMADTGRWKSGFHTLPAGDTVKQIYSSRFKGGIIAMPDCSQAEVRMLASVCGDENLLKAFQQEGMDIHKYVASLCFHNGDIEAVTSTERKIAKGAVFGILYGESVEAFADSFTHGDMNEAEKIFNYFFTAFPKIAEYVEDAHNQFLTTNKIALRMMNRFINLEPMVIENGGDKNKVLRQSQNFIIQGQTCDLAGLILYNICKYIKDNNLKSKPFCFIHDSIEIDIHPDETFLMLDKLKPLFNEYPWNEFGVPMASDIVFSSNMGAEIETVDLIHDEDYNDVIITMDGFEDDIEEVIKLWNEVYDVCELIESEDKGELYVPISGLFQKKVTLSKLMGTTRKEVRRKYHVIRNSK